MNIFVYDTLAFSVDSDHTVQELVSDDGCGCFRVSLPHIERIAG